MKQLLLFILGIITPLAYAKTVTSIAITPQGAVIQSGSTVQFSAACTYSDASTDNCAAAGGVTWTSSLSSAMTVSSTGLVKWVVDPGANRYNGGAVIAAAGGVTDKAGVFGQHPGDVWTTYVTPDPQNFVANETGNALPLNVAVGSSVALGYGFQINGSQNNPMQSTCTWSSSDSSVATINRMGHVTGVAPGTVTLTCGRAGNGAYGTSGTRRWVAPGNVISLTVVAGGTSNQTWYVRPDGGTPFTDSATTPYGQCNGKVDAAYPGSTDIWRPNLAYSLNALVAENGRYQKVTTAGTSGTSGHPSFSTATGGTTTDGTVTWTNMGPFPVNQACAMQNIRYLWSNEVGYINVAWMISGGDTVIVRKNPAGYNGNGEAFNYPGNCHGNLNDCWMPSIPSGTAARHTRILGENYANCASDSAKTLLNVTYGGEAAFNVKDSQFVDVACFEITDKAAYGGGNFTTARFPSGSSADFGGTYGVVTSSLTASTNLTDLFIHGLGEGIHGASGVGLVEDRVHIRGMVSAGINMDDNPFNLNNISVSGGLTLTNSTIEFSGCIEEYPVVHNYPYIECRDQNTGGYGDGLGTASTSGDWYFDHDLWFANFQDGLDLLHSGMRTLTVTNSRSEANDGQAFKIGSGDNIIFRNNIAKVNCDRILYTFGDEPASAIVPGVSPCRAAGDGVLFNFTDQGTYSVQNNTFVGDNATMFDLFCEGGWDYCSNANTIFQNNVVLGYSGGGQAPGLFYLENTSMPANGGWGVRDHNFYYNMRACPTPLQAGEVCDTKSPSFVGQPASPFTNVQVLDNFNFSPTASSPLNGAGVKIAAIPLDIMSAVRPNPPAIGAMEFSSTTTKTGAQVTLTATPTTSTAGQTVTFTATVATIAGVVPTGAVTLMNGTTNLGTLTLNSSGVGTLAISSLAAGNYSLAGSYSGDTNYTAGTSSPVLLSVGAAPVLAVASQTALSVATTTVTVGQTVNFIATVATLNNVVPTGVITFRNGTATLGTGTLNGAGVASFSSSSLAVGSYTVTASYAGDTHYLASTSTAKPLTVNGAKSVASVGLGVTPKPATVGQAVAFTATVATLNSVVPTGTVRFLNGATLLGTGTLNGAGVASFSSSSLTAATYTVTASYAGDTNYLTGNSASTSLVVSAAKSAASVGLGVTPKPARVGQAVALTATVATLNSVVPTGAITFRNGSATIGTATLNGAGVASFSTSSLTAGTYAVTASYAGDTNYLTGASTATSLVVNAAKSSATVMLGVASNPSIAGRPVSLTATVNTVNGVAATGTITFMNGLKVLGTATLNGSGVATTSSAALAAGTYPVIALYAGDTNYNAGASSVVSLTVRAGISPSQTALTATPNQLKAGQTAALSAKVAAVSGLQPTGTVTFMNGMKVFGTSTLGGDGVATLTTAKLSAATYSLTAAYSGDTNYSPSTSNAVALTVSSAASVSIAVAQPEFGFNVIPGSTRRLFASITNGSTDTALWTVKSGTATLGSASGSWVDVVAPATGAACTYANNGTDYTVTSATTFTVEAVAADDSTQKADVTFNVCNPKVQVAVVPFYRTLYKNQPADLQSLVLGSVNANVHWTISSQPMGGDGKLGDSTSRDTVFAASVAGRYTLTATSQADTAKTATAVLYVTPNAVPYTNPVTPNMTVPVDCTVDPAMAGTVYEVGPSQAFHTLASVPFPTMPAGSTVRVHNEDTTGLHATEYHEYVQIAQQATAAQPIRICGVPDTTGNLPILDGSGATGRSDDSSAIAGLGLITLHNDASTKVWPEYSAAAYVVVEGLHLRNAKTGFSYTTASGSSAAWTDTSACVRVNQGQNTAFIGNDLDNCGTGAMSAWNKDGGWGSSNLNALWEGNHLHNNGVAGSSKSNQMDLQAWGEVVQFNRIDNPTKGSLGANLKSRGLQNVIRYNYLADGPARQMDLVDVKSGATYMSFSGFLEGGSSSYHATNPSDSYTADQLAAEQEAWNSHFVYGNIYQNGVSLNPIHFGMDTAGGELARKGSLYWYNNTFYQKACTTDCSTPFTMFDTTAGDGNFLTQVEFPTVQSFNNVIWMDDVTKPTFQWNNSSTFIGVSGKNLLPANWGTNATTGGAGTGWNATDTTNAYQNSTDLAAHVSGFTSSNLATTPSVPFDTTSWALSADVAGSSVVPDAVCEMPARFAYLPSLGYAISRIATANLGATDTVAEMGAQMTSIRGVSRYNSHYSNCR